MTTHVDSSRPVRREVRTARGLAVIVEIGPHGLTLREKRRRTSYLLPFGVAYQRAVALAVEAARAERKAMRRAKRRGAR